MPRHYGYNTAHALGARGGDSQSDVEVEKPPPELMPRELVAPFLHVTELQILGLPPISLLVAASKSSSGLKDPWGIDPGV